MRRDMSKVIVERPRYGMANRVAIAKRPLSKRDLKRYGLINGMHAPPTKRPP